MNQDTLIASVYEAALEPDRWGAALDGLRALAGSQGAALMFGSPTSGRVGIAQGHSPESAVDYDGYYNALDPLIPFGFSRPPGTWCNDWRIAGRRFDRTEYYNDFYRKHDWHACTASVLHADADFWACLSFQRVRGKPAFESADEARVEPVLPHLRRAFRLYRETESLREQADLAQAALSCIDTAVWIVDRRARVLLANAAATALVAQGSAVEERGGFLRTVHGDRGAFERALGLATTPGAGQASWVRLGKGGGRLLTVMPIAESANRHRVPVAAVLLKVGGPPQRAADALRSLYGLTPREAEIACRVAAGARPKEVAETLGLSAETVRSYLKIVYAKSGLRSQSELARTLGQVAAQSD